MYYLGLMYYEGNICERNLEKSQKLFQKSSELGFADSYNAMAVNLEAEFPLLSLEYYEKAKEMGSIKAAYNLGLLYYNGSIVAKDYTKAKEFYNISAKKEYPQALTNLGLIYHLGRGAEKDVQTAIGYYKRSSLKFCHVGMFNLALLYEEIKEYDNAREYYEKCFIHDYKDYCKNTIHNLKNLYAKKLVLFDEKILKWYEKERFRQTKDRIVKLKKLHELGLGNYNSLFYKKFIHFYEFEIQNNILNTKNNFIDIYFVLC
jgi:uncharacterized protein